MVAYAICIVIFSSTLLVTANYFGQTSQASNIPPILPTRLTTASPTRPSFCVSVPQNIISTTTQTPTPNRWGTPDSNLRPTATARTFKNIYDLSPMVDASYKSEIIVFRCNGNSDLYFVGPEVDITNAIILLPGDMIIFSAPPAYLMGHKPSEPTILPTMEIQTSFPYPPPNTSTVEAMTLVPYLPPNSPND